MRHINRQIEHFPQKIDVLFHNRTDGERGQFISGCNMWRAYPQL